MAAVAGVVVALMLPQQAAAAPRAAPASAPVDHVAADAPSAELVAALRRDVGLTAEQAQQWLARVAAAAHTEQDLRHALGADFGGAWVTDDGGQLVVAVTDPAAADQVRAAGAAPRLVSHSEPELASVKAKLDRAAPAPESVTGWYVDVESNTVVVEARPDARPAALQFIEASGLAGEPVRIEQATGSPQLRQYPLREGDPYFVHGARCTVGFLVVTPGGDNGFVTAGHCGSVGTITQGFNNEVQGIFQVSVFPGRDYAVVVVNDNWIPTPSAAGSQEAPIGAAVCKIGSTTGITCGTITQKNATVNYPQGTVTGLTRTTICAEPGDSGAPVFAGDQAQGIVSGGSGNCAFGGVTFFQPINPILSALNLTLLTA